MRRLAAIMRRGGTLDVLNRETLFGRRHEVGIPEILEVVPQTGMARLADACHVHSARGRRAPGARVTGGGHAGRHRDWRGAHPRKTSTRPVRSSPRHAGHALPPNRDHAIELGVSKSLRPVVPYV